jgi:G3E family GTPase
MQSEPQFVIVSGMLGSGKTSMVESLLNAVGAADTAVIVNEAGEINIDGAVLSESAGGMPIATLSNGCVCCSLQSDLVNTVQDLMQFRRASEQEPFSRVVLECSGISRPGPIVSSLQDLASFRFKLHLVTTYDCSRPALHTVDFEDAVAQLAAAGTIVLTKIDLVANERRNEALEAVIAINPLARVVNEFSASVRAREAFTLPDITDVFVGKTKTEQSGPQRLIHPRVRAFHAKYDANMPCGVALDWLENIAGALGERLLRIKAVIPGENTADRLLLQSVGTTFFAPRLLKPETSVSFGAIVIARDCGTQELASIPAAHQVRWFQER